jgi:hypothetical protein
MPSEKYSCSASPLMLLKASTAIDPRQDAILVGAGQAAESDHVRNQDRRNLPYLAHDPRLCRPRE